MSDETPGLASSDAGDPTRRHAARAASSVSPLIFTPRGHGRRAYVTQEIVDVLDAFRGDGRKTLVIDGSKRSDS